jgi:predicted alpha/beta-hydrolase family hydrolase
VKVDTKAGRVSLVIEGEGDDIVVLAHGAGADLTHPYMEHFAKGLVRRGLSVARFNFSYAEAGRRSPERQQVLEDTYRTIVGYLRKRSHRRMFLGGKSMGGRIASHIAAPPDPEAIDGLVFLGYPLHPPGKPDRVRDGHLPDVGAPMLFVEGTRDPFCPLETLDDVIRKHGLDAAVVVIDDGDHSLKVRKSSGRTTPEAWDEAVAAISGWVGDRQ